MTTYKKLWWDQMIEKYGSEEAVRASMRDRAERGKGRNAKISLKDVEIIRASSETNKVLGEKYGVHPTHISRIRNNRSRG